MTEEPVFYTVDEVASVLRIGRYQVRRKLRSGEIQALKVGRRWLIRREEMQRLRRGQAA